MTNLFSLLFLFWLPAAIATAVVANNKGRSEIGWLALGLFLGPLALLAIAHAEPNAEVMNRRKIEQYKMRRCEACLSAVEIKATKCRYCGTETVPFVG